MKTLSTEYRRQLDRTVVEARDIDVHLTDAEKRVARKGGAQ